MEHPNVMLIGHSFIRRYRDHLITPENGRKSGRDISESRSHVATQAARAALLAHRVSAIYTAANNINLVTDLWKAETTFENTRPNIVVMHVGSNDLAAMSIFDQNLAEFWAQEVLNFALRLQSVFKVEGILLLSVLPRTGRLAAQPEIFRQNMNVFNNHLKSLVAPLPGIQFKYVRGFHFKKVDGHDTPARYRNGPMTAFTVTQHP